MTLRPALTLGARLWWGLLPLVVMVWALGLLAATGLPGLPQAPAAIEWLLPATRYARDIASMLTLGLVVVGLLLTHWRPARTWALVWSLLWLGLLVVQYLLTLADIRAQGLADATGTALSSLTDGAVGWAFLVQGACVVLGIAGLVLTRGRAVPIRVVVLVAAVLAVGCAAPAAISHAGHSHLAASVSIAVHIVAVSLWVGGLATVLVIATTTPESGVLPRFSRMALWCVIVVAETGLLNASLLVPSPWSFLGTQYGALVLAKAFLLGLLVRWGWRQRRRLGDVARLGRFAGGEAVVMASAIAASVVLARLGPPVLAPRYLDPLAAGVLALAVPLLLTRLPWRPRVLTWLTRLPEVGAIVLLVALGLAFLVTAAAAPGDASPAGLSPGAVLVPLLVAAGLLAAGWVWCSTTRGWPATVIALVGWVVIACVAQSRVVVPDWRWTAVCALVGACCILTTAPRRLAIPVMAR